MAARINAGHEAEVETWRAQRYAALRRPLGWLTLAGLAWLREGDNSLGADPAGEIVLPSGPTRAGRLHVAGGTVTAHDDSGGGLSHEGRAVQDLPMIADVDGPDGRGPTVLELGPLRLCVIRRGDRLGVRTWDTEAAALQTFDGIDHWPVDPAWRLAARLEPAAESSMIDVPDVLGDVAQQPTPGTVAFEVDGVTHRLEALHGGDAGELWLVFGDATNGNETYDGGRFVYTVPPDADGRVILDLNRAHNPPCVFSPYATCPLPWAANRLPVRIEAGERRYGGRAHEPRRRPGPSGDGGE